MEHVRLGRTGLRVSRIGLGCMSYGPARAGVHQWTLDEDAAASFFRQAVEAGVTFWDTANVYQGGTSEEFVGRAIGRYSRREDIVLATKVSGRCMMARAVGPVPQGDPGAVGCLAAPAGHRLPRRVLLAPVRHHTPVEETMATLHDVVKAGKVRYLGASSMWAWQFAKLQHAAHVNGWTTFSAMQDQYNVLEREEERDMIPLCRDQGVGLTPYSPLAKGRATRPWGEQTARSSTDSVARRSIEPSTSLSSTRSRRSLQARGVTDGAGRPGMGAVQTGGVRPIVGATKAHHLTDAVAALDIELTDEQYDESRRQRRSSPSSRWRKRRACRARR